MFIKIIDNALDNEMVHYALKEAQTIDYPKTFNRAGSLMYENNGVHLGSLKRLYNRLSTQEWLTYLENCIGIQGILPDPYMIGAGYSLIKEGDDLKPHVDFNWNDRIKMHKVCSVILYLSDHEGGELVFEGKEEIETKKNRMVIFEHSETVRHYVKPVKGERYNVRFFYYASLQNPPEGYHRSLYGLKDGIPVDVR